VCFLFALVVSRRDDKKILNSTLVKFPGIQSDLEYLFIYIFFSGKSYCWTCWEGVDWIDLAEDRDVWVL
jgi:hypothetical protein